MPRNPDQVPPIEMTVVPEDMCLFDMLSFFEVLVEQCQRRPAALMQQAIVSRMDLMRASMDEPGDLEVEFQLEDEEDEEEEDDG